MPSRGLSPPHQALSRACASIQLLPHLSRRRGWVARPQRPAAAADGASGVPPEMQAGLPEMQAGWLDTSLLANPAIAQREALRQFYIAATPEAQMAAARKAAALGDLGTCLNLLCHMADLAQKGVLPGTPQQQADLLRFVHSSLEPSLAGMGARPLATMLWAYAAVGLPAAWTDALLQQVAERELGAGPERLAGYNTKELSSLLYAYGCLLRQPTPESRAYGAVLAGELLQRFGAQPYVRSAFTSADFADLAQTCAALFGSSSPAAQPASGGGSSSGGGVAGPPSEPLPAEVVRLLDELAGEVRRQLGNKSSRSPWAPRDLVRITRAYAALGHRTPRTSQMLDSLSSFCVQRIRARHLNCLSRPADLLSLLEAYADLAHVSVAVPELLAAVGDQVRRGVAAQQEQLDAAAAAAAAAAAEAAAAAGAAAGAPATLPPAEQQQPGLPAEAFSLAGINSLLASHLRLGYLPDALLLASLSPVMRRGTAASTPLDAARLLHLLAAVGHNPGASVVGLLLGRVMDGEAAAAGGQAAERSELAAAAVAAVDRLLGDNPGSS